MTQSLEVLSGCDLWAIKASLGMYVLEESRGAGVGRAGVPQVKESLLVQGREREPEPHSQGPPFIRTQACTDAEARKV